VSPLCQKKRGARARARVATIGESHFPSIPSVRAQSVAANGNGKNQKKRTSKTIVERAPSFARRWTIRSIPEWLAIGFPRAAAAAAAAAAASPRKGR